MECSCSNTTACCRIPVCCLASSSRQEGIAHAFSIICSIRNNNSHDEQWDRYHDQYNGPRERILNCPRDCNSCGKRRKVAAAALGVQRLNLMVYGERFLAALEPHGLSHMVDKDYKATSKGLGNSSSQQNSKSDLALAGSILLFCAIYLFMRWIKKPQSISNLFHPFKRRLILFSCLVSYCHCHISNSIYDCNQKEYHPCHTIPKHIIQLSKKLLTFIFVRKGNIRHWLAQKLAEWFPSLLDIKY